MDQQKEWNQHVYHPLQSWEWGDFRKKTNIDVFRTNFWQITFHHIPHFPWTIGYFPKGPSITQKMINELMTLGKRKNAIYIQIEPNDTHPLNPQLPALSSLRPSHHPLFTKYTFVLDLTKSEEDLLKTMHSKTRYNIKVAQKHEVKILEDSSDTAFAEYLRLTEETTKRQGFYAHSNSYHSKMWDTMSKSGIAKLFTATYQGKTLATWIIFAFGDTIYYPYGASSRDLREVMAPTLMLWEIARWGKKNGYKKFDLWGAMGPNPDPNDPWYGFHRFKEGFHPELVEYVGSYDLVVNPILYSGYCIADTLRWKFLRARKK